MQMVKFLQPMKQTSLDASQMVGWTGDQRDAWQELTEKSPSVLLSDSIAFTTVKAHIFLCHSFVSKLFILIVGGSLFGYWQGIQVPLLPGLPAPKTAASNNMMGQMQGVNPMQQQMMAMMQMQQMQQMQMQGMQSPAMDPMQMQQMQQMQMQMMQAQMQAGMQGQPMPGMQPMMPGMQPMMNMGLPGPNPMSGPPPQGMQPMQVQGAPGV
jgi:hypothetical protein